MKKKKTRRAQNIENLHNERIFMVKNVQIQILKDTSLFFTTSMNFYFFPLYKFFALIYNDVRTYIQTLTKHQNTQSFVFHNFEKKKKKK